MVGRTVQVMVEGESKLVNKPPAYPKSPGGAVELLWERRKAAAAAVPGSAPATATQLTGRTRGDQVVVFNGDRSLKGRLLDVEIVAARSLTLFGRLAEQPAAVA
jgi:hypothetical protein